MRVTMVKKILASGEPCDKCVQAEERLRERGLWASMNTVVAADERDPESPGWALANEHGVDTAPFWIVEYSEPGNVEVVTSVLRLTRVLAAVADTQSHATIDLAPKTRGQVRQVADAMVKASAEELVRWAFMTYGKECGIAFSGAEDVVLIDMAAKSGQKFSVFTLDTGRLHPETYAYLELVSKHYKLDLQVMTPDSPTLEAFVADKGLFSFLIDGHKECCGIRKVAPLKRALGSRRAWMTGQRKDQSPTRANVDRLHVDDGFSGTGPEGVLVKVNPLADWTSAQVWRYISQHNLPYNPLHDRGFRSIGCAPCTRATNPGEHERAGRWWWEEETKRECGLHLPT